MRLSAVPAASTCSQPPQHLPHAGQRASQRMDIRQWLHDTADRVPPDPSDDLHAHEIFRPHHQGSDRPGRDYRHKRKRASSDSSLIAPNPITRLHAKAATPSQLSDHVRPADDGVAASESFQPSRTAHSILEHGTAKTYQKRPRHKTRPDRYEPKPKKKLKERDAPRESKSGNKRRKSHRSGDGGRTTGLVQNFHLNNGPKNSRLTVSPSGLKFPCHH